MGLWPTQREENQIEEGLVGNYTYLCHLDRSETGVPGKRSLLGWEAEWRDLWFPSNRNHRS
jgi:hypothetical protein